MNLLLRPPVKMTADEFFELVGRPENEALSFELVRGLVIEVSRPTRWHGVICGNVARILGNWTFAERTGYVVSNDTGVLLERDPDTVRGPDVAYHNDVTEVDDLPDKWGETPPRLAVEVLSPNDRADYINIKIADYLACGVDVVWIIDPEVRTVTVYASSAGPRRFGEKAQLTEGKILPGFSCKVADFFRLPGSRGKGKRKKPRPAD